LIHSEQWTCCCWASQGRVWNWLFQIFESLADVTLTDLDRSVMVTVAWGILKLIQQCFKSCPQTKILLLLIKFI
jgi:hypothetical protein